MPLSFQVLVRPECGTCSKRPGSELRVLSTLMRLMQLGEKELEGQTVFAFVRMRACMRVCVCVCLHSVHGCLYACNFIHKIGLLQAMFCFHKLR